MWSEIMSSLSPIFLFEEKYSIDEKHDLTIYLTTGTGKAKVTSIYVNEVQVYPTYFLIPPRVEKRAGELVHIVVELENVGEVASRLWAQIIDKDTGAVPAGGKALVSFTKIEPGMRYSFAFTLTMPNKNWNLQIWAGHVEE